MYYLPNRLAQLSQQYKASNFLQLIHEMDASVIHHHRKNPVHMVHQLKKILILEIQLKSKKKNIFLIINLVKEE